MKTKTRKPSIEACARCSGCGCEAKSKASKSGDAKVPMGWKRTSEGMLCRSCMQSAYRTVACALPIVKPLGATWDEFGTALRTAWERSTSLSTWAMARMHLADPGLDAEKKKLHPMPELNLYAEIRGRFPDVPCGTVAAMAQSLRSKYMSARFGIMVNNGKGGRSDWPKFRYPTPFPIRAQGSEWAVAKQGQEYILSFNLCDKRWDVVLRQGKDFRRQIGMVDQLIGGDALKCELALYSIRANDGDRRSGMSEREPGGGERSRRRVMAKLVLRIPRTTKRSGDRTMVLKALPHSFLVARMAGQTSNGWWLHGDHQMRRIAQHRRMMRRMSDDMKSEQRSKRGGLQGRISRQSKKHRDYMKSFVQTTAASIVSYAQRQHVGRIVFDDRKGEYFESFPWFEFWAYLKEKAMPIEVVSVSTFKAEKELAELELVLADMANREDRRNGRNDDDKDGSCNTVAGILAGA